MQEIAALAAEGPWVFVSVLMAVALGALFVQNNRLNDMVRDCGKQSAKEYREALTKMMEHAAATQMALQVNAQTIAALERTISSMERQR